MNTVACPNCGTTITVSFSRNEELAGGKAVVCHGCNSHFWLFTDGVTQFFPAATDQQGQPRELRQIQ